MKKLEIKWNHKDYIQGHICNDNFLIFSYLLSMTIQFGLNNGLMGVT